MGDMERKILQSVSAVEKWVEDHGYKGYEYSDGLLSPLRVLTFHNLFLERCLLQLVRLSPVNIRPLVGVKPQDSTKGRGYMAWGYLTMYRMTGERSYKEKASDCFRWLDENKAKNYEAHSWGNHFPFSSRGGRVPMLEPIIVWTGLIGQAYLDGYQILGEERYLEIARSICRWICDLPRERTDPGHVPELRGLRAELDPQLEHDRRRDAGEDRAHHRGTGRAGPGPGSDGVQLHAPIAGRGMVLRRVREFPLGR